MNCYVQWNSPLEGEANKTNLFKQAGSITTSYYRAACGRSFLCFPGRSIQPRSNWSFMTGLHMMNWPVSNATILGYPWIKQQNCMISKRLLGPLVWFEFQFQEPRSEWSGILTSDIPCTVPDNQLSGTIRRTFSSVNNGFPILFKRSNELLQIPENPEYFILLFLPINRSIPDTTESGIFHSIFGYPDNVSVKDRTKYSGYSSNRDIAFDFIVHE